ncbi:NAD-dependent epimerase/dehydratase family protein, partial [bacterium]|nr:NAD-dependent epimerase/dehydratase family protein [bacterium]
MPTIEFESTVNAPAGEILAWHSRPGAFDRLAPPWMRLEVLERHGDISSGSRLTFRVGKGLFSVKWEALHSRNREGLGFTDVQVHGPFAAWRHEHRFTPVSLETCLIRDRVRYQLPLGWVGRAVAGTQVRHRLERLFAWRHRRLKDDLERHHHFEDRPRLKIAVTGSSGLIGSQLCAFLTTGGHSVYPLVRRQADPESLEIEWDPREGRIQTEKLEGMDAAIHLAGENIAGIWTKSKREKILQSRTEGTRLLAETLAGLERKPRVLISASALGWYGDHGDRKIHVGANVGSGFLARVCREWEAAADPAREAGIRVVHPRIGMVLSAQGGALA